ncbi:MULTISPECIES: transposase [unclassified Streptomyces]|uniref:transposase n=1 Tax=Streptomyces sp. SID8381 TaxID=2690361 RepID=UPI0018F8ADED|nr:MULTISPECIES: transposase [unclassified Streptomyces]
MTSATLDSDPPASAANREPWPRPTHAPDLDPTEGVWSLLKRDIGNLAAADLGRITRAVKRKLKMLRYRPEVIDGCLAGTDLLLDL